MHLVMISESAVLVITGPQQHASLDLRMCHISFLRLQGEATAALAAIAVGNRTKLPEQPLADMGSSTAVHASLKLLVHLAYPIACPHCL